MSWSLHSTRLIEEWAQERSVEVKLAQDILGLQLVDLQRAQAWVFAFSVPYTVNPDRSSWPLLRSQPGY
jgi:hypothetical protein